MSLCYEEQWGNGLEENTSYVLWELYQTQKHNMWEKCTTFESENNRPCTLKQLSWRFVFIHELPASKLHRSCNSNSTLINSLHKEIRRCVIKEAGNVVWYSANVRNSSLSQGARMCRGTHAGSYSIGIWGLLPRVKKVEAWGWPLTLF
jgi:hypothetical protein